MVSIHDLKPENTLLDRESFLLLGSCEFSPSIDVFDTPDSFIVHVSLPGSVGENIAISYDEEKSEVQISGVLRNGDERFLKTLAIAERETGLFGRGVRLGSKKHPAAANADDIMAKLENGVLEVVIPKKEKVKKKRIEIS